MRQLKVGFIRFLCVWACGLILISCGATQKNREQLTSSAKSKPRPIPQLTHQQAKPLKVVQPCFPYRAIRLNAEGWVQLEFSLDEQGLPVDIQPIDDSPKGIFKDCALKSLRKWSFDLPREHQKDARYQFVFLFKLG
ncbi:energy transducer TonB [Aliikangiella sp. IMCC44632]